MGFFQEGWGLALKHCMDKNDHLKSEKNSLYFWGYMNKYIELHDKLNAEILISQAYIPKDILISCSALAKNMYDDSISLLELGTTMFDDGSDVDEKIIQDMFDKFLKSIVLPSALIRERLRELSSLQKEN